VHFFVLALFDWKAALVVVRPETLLRWQRASVRLYWRWESRPGRPKLAIEILDFIRRASRENPTWGQERIRDELRVKLGISVSARTVPK
jgi:putative transposase